MTARVLVVDDDDDLRALVALTLREAGYLVVEAADGPQALEAYHSQYLDLVVLDIGLGRMDGFEVCRRLRSLGEVPIVFLTSRAEEVDQLVGLAAGGDDYIIKPFSPRVLAARVANVLRRTGRDVADCPTYEAGGLRLDLNGRNCEYDGQAIHLTRTEFEILACLMEDPRRVVTRDALIKSVWGPWYGDQHLVESHISRLRKKVLDAGGPWVGQAVRGVGYKLGAVE